MLSVRPETPPSSDASEETSVTRAAHKSDPHECWILQCLWQRLMRPEFKSQKAFHPFFSTADAQDTSQMYTRMLSNSRAGKYGRHSSWIIEWKIVKSLTSYLSIFTSHAYLNNAVYQLIHLELLFYVNLTASLVSRCTRGLFIMD